MHLALEPAYSIFYNRRFGLLYDNRYQPCSRAPSKGRVAFYMMLAGTFATSNGLAADGPALFRMPEDVLEGASGVRPATLRAHGMPHISLSIYVDRSWVLGNVPGEPERLALSADVERAARAYAEIAEANAPSASVMRASAVLLDALSRERLFEARPSEHVGGAYERIWNGLSSFTSKLEAAPTLALLSDVVSISPRTVDRFLRQLTRAYGLPDESFRDLTRRWRLKLATLLLSSPALTVRVVAKRVGYRNAEALANALAAEGLLPPSHYRRLWDESF
jgi:AraC-like DNA-binding protein